MRIEALHRGFLYQHLYAAQCLLASAALGAISIAIETDEDIELILPGRHIYIQVKHRQDRLAWSDISGAVKRFEALRALHADGTRAGVPELVIVSNAVPNGPLAERIAADDWPADVCVDWPAAEAERGGRPSPAASLSDAINQTRSRAESLPFAMLAPETLVWKLAGVITLVAAGGGAGPAHHFTAADLPALFEQLVLQLQDLPAPPSPYRVQVDEPALISDSRIRLITGYSGAGKTSWVAQSAQHAEGALVYFDVSDVPGTALASTLSRDLAARLFGGDGGRLGEVLLPGASGRELLQRISGLVRERGHTAMVVLDNAHQIPVDDLTAVIQAAPDLQFMLLCRPVADVQTLEDMIGIVREDLRGWGPDTVAAEVHAAGCRANAAVCQRLIDLTGGLPLYVQNAVSIAKLEYGGDVAAFCSDLEATAHTRGTVQEAILGRLFAALPAAVATTADLLSLVDLPVARTEVLAYLAGAGQTAAAAAGSLRHLRTTGLLQVYAGDRLKMHDAARVIGKVRLALTDADRLSERRRALRDLMTAGIAADWSPARVSAILRLSGEIGDMEPLVEMATDELFHEMGFMPQIEAFLETAVTDETIDADQRLKALDGLVFGDLKAGREDRAEAWLDQMDGLIAKHDLGAEESLRVGLKRMNMLATQGKRKPALALMASLEKAIEPLSEGHRRVYRYNAGVAHLSLGDFAKAIDIFDPLIGEYYELLGLTPNQVIQRNAPDLRPMLKPGPDQQDHAKHLADTLDALAKAMDGLGQISPFARIHALKFYDLARAPHSLLRVGQDLTDQFIGQSDFEGARHFMETILLPQLGQWKLADFLIPVRSQYAVVLAYCGAFNEAEAEMERLRPYEAGLDDRGQGELAGQRRLIAQLRLYGPPPQKRLPPDFEKRAKAALAAMAEGPAPIGAPDAS